MSGSTKTPKKPAAKAIKAVKAASATASAKTRTSQVKKPAKRTVSKVTVKPDIKAVKKPAAKPVRATRPASKKAAPGRKTVVAATAAHPAHDVASLHMPASPHPHARPKPKIGESWMWVSFFLTFLFIYSITENVVNARSGITSGPSSYAAIPALALAVIVWKANRTKSTYTGMVVVLSMLSAGIFIWFFGITNASTLLFR